jgi:hypothetical protein
MLPSLAVLLISALMSRIATFETSMGTFKAELFCSQMPITWYVLVIVFAKFFLLDEIQK